MSDETAAAKSPEFLIEGILPSREVHLFAGPSGAGKTSWLLRMLVEWQQGHDILGNKSHPVPMCYVSLDRSPAGLQRTLRRLQLPPDPFPLFVPESLSQRQWSIERVIDHVIAVHHSKFLVIEGFASKLPAGKNVDYAIVSAYLTGLTDFCRTHDVTILGVTHSAKTKEGERYLNPRQRTLGSVAWAAYTETVFLIEPASPDDPEDDSRVLMVLPRNAPERAYKIAFDDSGILIPIEDKAATEAKVVFYMHLSGLRVNELTSRAKIISATLLKTRTVARFLVDAVKEGYLLPEEYGMYKRSILQVPRTRLEGEKNE